MVSLLLLLLSFPCLPIPCTLESFLNSSKPFLAALCSQHKTQTPSNAHEGRMTIPDPSHYPPSTFPTPNLSCSSHILSHFLASVFACNVHSACDDFPSHFSARRTPTHPSRLSSSNPSSLKPSLISPSIISNPQEESVAINIFMCICHIHQAGGVLRDREWISFACCILSTGHRTSINID